MTERLNMDYSTDSDPEINWGFCCHCGVPASVWFARPEDDEPVGTCAQCFDLISLDTRVARRN